MPSYRKKKKFETEQSVHNNDVQVDEVSWKW